jgi:hypothetical protein
VFNISAGYTGSHLAERIKRFLSCWQVLKVYILLAGSEGVYLAGFEGFYPDGRI